MTAIGIISIVVAVLGTLGALGSAFGLFVFSMMARVAPFAMPPAPATTATTQAIVVSTRPAAARGLPENVRSNISTGLSELRELSEPRLQQLDALLADAGQDMFRVKDGSITASEATNQIQSNVTGLVTGENAIGPDIFRTADGRFELYDDHGVFYPTRGEIVRANATAPNTPLTPAEIDSVIAQAQTKTAVVLNPAQVAALKTLLGQPGQTFVTPANVQTAVSDVELDPDGETVVSFANDSVSLGVHGEHTVISQSAVSAAPTTTTPGFPFSNVRLSSGAVTLAIVEILASLALSIYLLVSGILVLRNSPHGRKLHFLYAAFKLPMAILGAAATWWLTSSYMESLAASGSAPFGMTAASAFSTPVAIQAAIAAVVGSIYPIALLITLNSATVKGYYNTVSE